MKSRLFPSVSPPASAGPGLLAKVDFEDAFTLLGVGNEASIEEVYLKIFNTSPRWVELALRLRNWLVGPLGLKTSADKTLETSLKEGEKVGIFRIYKMLENEIIAGEDDRHLDFRVSVYRDKAHPGSITLSTFVQYKNRWGRLYMILISPFHKMVVKSILKSYLKREKAPAGPELSL